MLMELDVRKHIDQFFVHVAAGTVEVYNEFSLQHELGCYLRRALPTGLKIHFERPAGYFGVAQKLRKKELDLSILSTGKTLEAAIELKYPLNGRYPEQMYKACEDLCFLEQLCSNGFRRGYFVMVAEARPFYSGTSEGIYRHFRGGVPLCGTITKPTGARDTEVVLYGSYALEWREVSGSRKYLVVEVGSTPHRPDSPG